jgi:sugar/nucleoside kinase (ribokinase family)
MVTSFSYPLLTPSIFKGIEVCCRESRHTTTFANLYNEQGTRRQIVEKVAEPLTPDFVPDAWRSTNIVNLCPVANEYSAEIIHLFEGSLIGVCPQGWMRWWGSDGHVHRKEWETFKEVLPHADVVFFSQHDVANPEKTAKTYLDYTGLVVVTRGEQGASVYCHQGEEYHVPAFYADEIDPTGAGDVFAAAFLVNYFDTRDPVKAATFGNCVASFAVEKGGVFGIPLRGDVEYRLKNRKRR